jgi:hypothetical protein
MTNQNECKKIIRYRFFRNDVEHLVEAAVWPGEEITVEVTRIVNEDGEELDDILFDADARRELYATAIEAYAFQMPDDRPVFFPDEIDAALLYLKDQIEAEDFYLLRRDEAAQRMEAARQRKEWTRQEIKYLREMQAHATVDQ